MDFTTDELETAWRACDNLAVAALVMRTRGGYNTHDYVVEDNKLYRDALALRERFKTELDSRKEMKCKPAQP